MTTNDNERHISIGQNDWRNLLITEFKRTGGDPSVLFEILEGIIQQRAWESLTDTEGNSIGSLKRLIEAPPPIGCGQKVEKILKLIDIEHRYENENNEWHTRMSNLRENLREELGQSTKISEADIENTPNSEKITTREELSLAKYIDNNNPDLINLVTSKKEEIARDQLQNKNRPRTTLIYPSDWKRTAKVLKKMFNNNELYLIIMNIIELDE